ncbi:hypothetical protein J3F84DRAFT_358093 [Trichoderma pleuroticola]
MINPMLLYLWPLLPFRNTYCLATPVLSFRMDVWAVLWGGCRGSCRVQQPGMAILLQYPVQCSVGALFQLLAQQSSRQTRANSDYVF